MSERDRGFLPPPSSMATRGRGLVIRPFVQGRDEEAWISISNEFLGHFLSPDYTPMSREDLEWFEGSPWFDPSGLFVAELDGKPIGIIRIHVDKRRRDQYGTISIELRLDYVGSEHERQMLLFCLGNLRTRGVRRARMWVRDNMKERIELLEGEGFREVRSFSVMRMRLDQLKHGIGECKRVRLRPIELKSRRDLELLTFLLNEAFKGQFGFRPTTVEESEAWLSQPSKEFYGLFAYWDRTPIGYVVLEVDKKLLEAGRKVGEVSSIGVLRPYRRLGVGTALMLKGLEWLRDRGLEEARLEVDDDNPTKAIKLYEKVGFEVERKLLVYERAI